MSDILFLRDLNDGRIKIFGVSDKGKNFLKREFPNDFPQTEICFMDDVEAWTYQEVWKSLGLKVVFT